MNWMENFIEQCLAEVPPGKYRTRTEKELEDHLEALRLDLEAAGRVPEEARAAALAQMGDPAELARRYVREWRRRSLGLRTLAGAEVLLVGVCMMVMGALYAANTPNFGKMWVAHWGNAAIVLVFILMGCFITRLWLLGRLACQALTVIQLPPIVLWIMCFSTFEFTGVMMVPWWLGLSIHLLFLFWGKANYKLFTRFQQEDDFLIRTRIGT